MDSLKIERIGGIAGFGMPNSRIRSLGTCRLADLAEADRAAVEKLFAGAGARRSRAMPDVFRYRLTRETPSGPQTVEVAEAVVPEAVAACVRDVLE